MQDFCEPFELLEFELDEVAGGNPNNFTLSISAIMSSVTTTVSQAFDNHATSSIAIAVDQSIS
jgi:hypothetical protein